MAPLGVLKGNSAKLSQNGFRAISFAHETESKGYVVDGDKDDKVGDKVRRRGRGRGRGRGRRQWMEALRAKALVATAGQVAAGAAMAVGDTRAVVAKATVRGNGDDDGERRWGTAMGGTEMPRFAACLPLQCDDVDDLQQGRARIRNGSAESAQRVAAVWLAA